MNYSDVGVSVDTWAMLAFTIIDKIKDSEHGIVLSRFDNQGCI